MQLQNSIDATCWLPNRMQVSWEALSCLIVNYTFASLSLWSQAPQNTRKMQYSPLSAPFLVTLGIPPLSRACLVLLICMFITIQQPKFGLFIQLIFHSLPHYLFIWFHYAEGASVNAQCCNFATPPLRLQLSIRPTGSTLIRQNMTRAGDQ